jgi:hypothetical protein
MKLRRLGPKPEMEVKTLSSSLPYSVRAWYPKKPTRILIVGLS